MQYSFAWLESKEYATFLVDFLHFCNTPEQGAYPCSSEPVSKHPHEPCLVRHVLPGLILQHFERVRAYEQLLGEPTQQPASEPVAEPVLHQLRIECKYLRYLLEFAQPLFSSACGRLITSLKELQEDLGQLNDAAVSRTLLAAHPQPRQVIAVQPYADALTQVIEERRGQATDHLQQFIAPENRRRLLLMLAQL